MILRLLERILDWFESDFPDIHPPECFDCNEGGSCKECPIHKEWKD